MNWHEYFTYDAETGNLIWKERPQEHFGNTQAHLAWNTKYAVKKAGNKRFGRGLPHAIGVKLNTVGYLAHRIIWEMVNGPIPSGMVVDHKDCNPFNNKIDNLRLATKAQNSHNSQLKISNKTGVKGVSIHSVTGKFIAQIKTNGKTLHLGVYDSLQDGAIAYAFASEILHGDFGRTA